MIGIGIERTNRSPITVIRYVRGVALFEDNLGRFAGTAVDNLGGVTLIFNINYLQSMLKVNWSVCRDDENFSKAMGIEVAKSNPHLLIPYNKSTTLVQNLIDWFRTFGDTPVPKNLQALQRKLMACYVPQ